MKQLAVEISGIIDVVEKISVDVEQNNNYAMIPELINLLEVILPNVFEINNKIKIFDDEYLIGVLEDIVNAYENNDSILTVDSLIYGLNYVLTSFKNKIEQMEP